MTKTQAKKLIDLLTAAIVNESTPATEELVAQARSGDDDHLYEIIREAYELGRRKVITEITETLVEFGDTEDTEAAVDIVRLNFPTDL